MAIQIGLILVIVALMIYIIILHQHLIRKNIFIETTVKRLSGIEKTRNMDEMIAFLREIKKFSQYKAYFIDKKLEESSINFILDNEKDTVTYIHYTKEEEDAKSILKDGFKFAESFYKTALPVLKDRLDITMKHNSRKYYGEYIILICISNDIVNFYSMELEKAGINNYTFENILTETPPSKNENSDLTYQLPFQYIKGYINYKTGKIVKNAAFDPWFNSPVYMQNIDRLKNN